MTMEDEASERSSAPHEDPTTHGNTDQVPAVPTVGAGSSMEEDITTENGVELVVSTADSHELKTFREHAKDVLRLTGPIIMSEIFQNTMPVIDIAFVGNLPDKNDLAAAALATVWFNLWNAAMLGFNTAIDTFLAQAYGAKKFRGYGLWTATSLVIVLVLTVFISGLVALCGPAMKLFGQDEQLAEKAQEFSVRLIPGLFPYFAFKVLVKYLQSQNITIPGAWIGFIANGVNILGNWTLIYALDMGLGGAPWATTITRFAQFFAVVVYMYWNRNTEKLSATWPRLSKDVFNYETLKPFGKLALSGTLSMSAEAWSFEIATILAGLIGTIQLDAHVITLSISTFIFLSFPFAIGVAASIRVGQWIGDGSASNAERSSKVSIFLAAAVQTILVIILFSSGNWLGTVFSSDDDVADLVSRLIPISCIFMLGDAVQATNGGIMRGLGRQRLVFWLNILAYWAIAIPLGSLLTFVGDVGVAGLWWGYVVGIYVSAFAGFLALRFKISWEQEVKEAKFRLSTMHSMQLDPSLRGKTPAEKESGDSTEKEVKEPVLDP